MSDLWDGFGGYRGDAEDWPEAMKASADASHREALHEEDARIMGRAICWVRCDCCGRYVMPGDVSSVAGLNACFDCRWDNVIRNDSR